MSARARPGDPAITPELVRSHGIRPAEFDGIRATLGRDPTIVELGIFSALWSEHRAHRHSRPVLRTFPTSGPQVIQGPGESAGVVRLGDGWAVAFKMGARSHPSAVEPCRGAATGSGGVLRDILAMGARPVALTDSLRFGPLEDPRQRHLFGGVVKGVGDYGNCVGVPTVAGDVCFEPEYAGNCLVNVMCVGLLREDELIHARAEGPGNPLIAVGSRAGREGIHGSSFASEELPAGNRSSRPQVQVGDPFAEKPLMEASLELIRSGHIVAIQDVGAAGLTSSSAEMAAKGGVGVEIDAALVPVREEGMTPYEVVLSESQERMLVVAKAGREAEVAAICAKWQLTGAVIGRVTDDGMYRVRWGADVVAEIPGRALVDDAPVCRPEARESDAARARRERPVPAFEARDDIGPALEGLLDLPNIACKRWVYEQYDASLLADTVLGPGGDAAVLRVRDSSLGVAVTSGGCGRHVWLDPYEGGKAVVAEAARNIAVTGARPLAVTDCLNFGNPEKPEIFHEFKEACRGLAEACAALGTPVVSGDVSFYNESPAGPVLPTPMIGMVGVLADVALRVATAFGRPGDAIVVLGHCNGAMGGSQYLSWLTGETFGSPPRVDLAAERELVDFLVEAAGRGMLRSAHDVSEGGLAVALVESAVAGPVPLGFAVDLSPLTRRVNPVQLFFAEDHGRAVVSCDPARVEEIRVLAHRRGVPAAAVGLVGEPGGTARIAVNGSALERPIARLAEIHRRAIPRRMERPAGA